MAFRALTALFFAIAMVFHPKKRRSNAVKWANRDGGQALEMMSQEHEARMQRWNQLQNPPVNEEEEEEEQEEEAANYWTEVGPSEPGPSSMAMVGAGSSANTTETGPWTFAPTLRPSWSEMQDFLRYIIHVETQIKDVPFFKIIPPTGWSARPGDEEYRNAHFVIDTPRTQTLQRLGNSLYHLIDQVRREPMPLQDYWTRYDRAPTGTNQAKFERIVENLDEDIDRHYGSEQRMSLFLPSCDRFNLTTLGTGLEEIGTFAGITTPYLYGGVYNSIFPLHVEDYNLHSASFLHRGAPKFWLGVPPSERGLLEDLARAQLPRPKRWPSTKQACAGFLQHKNFFVNPRGIVNHGLNCFLAIQEEGEFVITTPRGLHEGGNLGPNAAEAINFCTPRWYTEGHATLLCSCRKKTLRLNNSQFRSIQEHWRKNGII